MFFSSLLCFRCIFFCYLFSLPKSFIGNNLTYSYLPKFISTIFLAGHPVLTPKSCNSSWYKGTKCFDDDRWLCETNWFWWGLLIFCLFSGIILSLVVTEIYIGDFTSNHLPVPYGYPVILVSFFGWMLVLYIESKISVKHIQ